MVELSLQKNKFPTVLLNEDDIPGAKLNKPVEQCTINVLKRWLSCRGAKVGGKREELVIRVNDYMKNGLDKDLVDPDRGINIAKKRLSLGLSEEIDPEVNENFPTSGYSSGISGVPIISYSNIWKYLTDDVEYKKQLGTGKPIVKGYNFFKSGHVLQLFSMKDNNYHYVKSKVLPSMTKKKVYTVHIIIKQNGDVLKSMCGCPSGIDRRCNHLAATLFAMEYQFTMRNNVNTKENDPHNSPCTSQPCTWNIPSRKRKVEPRPIQSIHFEKHEYEKKIKHRKREANDVRAPYQRNLNSESQKLFYGKVKEVEKITGKKTGLSYILPHELPQSQCNESLSITTSESDPDEHLWNLHSPVKNGPMSLDDIAQKAERVKRRLFDSVENCTEIENKTRNQNSSMLWYNVRKIKNHSLSN